jgi:hypothetical protein
VLNGLARGVLHPPKPHLVPLRELPQDLAGKPPDWPKPGRAIPARSRPGRGRSCAAGRRYRGRRSDPATAVTAQVTAARDHAHVRRPGRGGSRATCHQRRTRATPDPAARHLAGAPGGA